MGGTCARSAAAGSHGESAEWTARVASFQSRSFTRRTYHGEAKVEKSLAIAIAIPMRHVAPLGLAAATFQSLSILAFSLDARLLVVATMLDLGQYAFLGHLLLEDLHRLFEAILANL